MEESGSCRNFTVLWMLLLYVTTMLAEKQEAPKFVYTSRNFVAVPALSHEPTIFRCNATGTPPLRYRWLKNEKDIRMRPLQPRMVTTLSYLELRNLVARDKGSYTCVVSNSYGSINHTFYLHVHEWARTKPILQQGLLQNTSVKVGANATLRCNVLYSPTMPDIIWCKFNDIPKTYPKMDLQINKESHLLECPNQNFTIVQKGVTYWHDPENQHFRSRLHIANVTEEDFRLYACVSFNNIGLSYVTGILSEETTIQITQISVLNANTTKSPLLHGNHTEIAHDFVNDKPAPNSINLALTILSAFLICLVGSAIIVGFIYLRKGRIRRNKLEDDQEMIFYQTDITTYDNSKSRSASSNSNSNSRAPQSQTTGSGTNFTFLTRTNSNISENDFQELIYDDEWEIDRNIIFLQDKVGEGAFGLVKKATAVGLPDHPSVCTVAVKMLKESGNDSDLVHLLYEMNVMKTIGQHTNIVNFLGACTQDGPLFIVVEYAPHGNLRQFLRERRPSEYHKSGPPLTIRDFVSFCFQISRGMEYLSSKKCIHRDLAARNILVGEDYVMKIADFGLARNVQEMDYYRKATQGRVPTKWLAIEALFDRVYTTQSDVWTFGILLWEIFTLGGSPYPSIPVESLFELLKSGYRMSKPLFCPVELYNIMLRCWNENPSSRPSFTDLRSEFDKMISSMTDTLYLEILAKSIDDIAEEVESIITDDSSCSTNQESERETVC